MLPLLDGWNFWRTFGKTKRTPVLMLTARDAGPDRVRGLDLGADDYLVKAVRSAELLARIRALIRVRPAGPARIELGEVVSIRVPATRPAASPCHDAREYSILSIWPSPWPGSVPHRTL